MFFTSIPLPLPPEEEGGHKHIHSLLLLEEG